MFFGKSKSDKEKQRFEKRLGALVHFFFFFFEKQLHINFFYINFSFEIPRETFNAVPA